MPSALRIGGHAARPLSSGVLDGRVASTFQYGSLLEIDSGAGPVLISLQTPEAAFHPWAVEVEGVPAAPVKTPVAGGPERIRWGDVTIELAGARIEPLEIEPYTAGQARVARDRASLLEANAFGSGEHGPMAPFEAAILRILSEWATFADPEAMAKLIGLGDGSTPAGDDILVGVLAGLRLGLRASAPNELARLEPVLRSDLDRTTLGSAQMLEAALDGAFPEPLLRLVHAIGDPKSGSEGILSEARSVRRLGASSGHAMLLGLHHALRPG